jgi:hypothetical protein
MKWEEIKISSDNKSYFYKGKRLFGRSFMDVLKFHSPGIAAVQDESGCYHIDYSGIELYRERYSRTFGYYCNRAAVVVEERSFHLTEKGVKAYPQDFRWCGNYQENLCPVRDQNNSYFHIDLEGNKIYPEKHLYAGDYKDGIACVKTTNGFYRHIDTKGDYINDKEFYDLGIFHKNYATAKDQIGWHHIDKTGSELYSHRYLSVEPFYNGFSVVETYDNVKLIINESGNTILQL